MITSHYVKTFIILQAITEKQYVTSLASIIQAGLQVTMATFEQSDLVLSS